MPKKVKVKRGKFFCLQLVFENFTNIALRSKIVLAKHKTLINIRFLVGIYV